MCRNRWQHLGTLHSRHCRHLWHLRHLKESSMIRRFLFVCAGLVLPAVPAIAQERSAHPPQPPIPARPGGPEGSPRTDQTVDVTKGTRLVVSNNAGEVLVRSWDRDQVREIG